MRVFSVRKMRKFNKSLTLIDSAQVFHWRKTPEGYAAIVNGRIMTDEDDSEAAAFYFDDARDYSRLACACRAYPKAMEAVQSLPGLRVLNQPAWEALVAFILSANNNVKRITRLVESLCAHYGSRAEYLGVTLYGFPTSAALARANEAELREKTRCGYRAPYLIRSARQIENGFDLDAVAKMNYDEAHRLLLTLPGVGDKVADCIQLFGMGHSCAFPVDVWVERLMKDWFVPEAATKKEIRAAAHALFGEDAGLIQQSLFHCARLGLIHLEKD